MKKIDIRNLFKYSEAGVHPQPTPDEWKIKKLIWNLRIDASILMGITEEEIIKKASHEIKCKEQNREYIDPKKQNFNHSKEWEKIDDTDFNQPIPEGGFKL
jgi:hypothetical protein